MCKFTGRILHDQRSLSRGDIRCGGSMVMASALSRCTFLQSLCDLKAASNVILFWDLHFATKNTCSTKAAGAVDLSTVNRWLKKFRSGCKNHDDQVEWGRHKAQNPKPCLKPQGQIWRVALGEYRVNSRISHSSVVRHFHDLGKCIRGKKKKFDLLLTFTQCTTSADPPFLLN